MNAVIEHLLKIERSVAGEEVIQACIWRMKNCFKVGKRAYRLGYQHANRKKQESVSFGVNTCYNSYNDVGRAVDGTHRTKNKVDVFKSINKSINKSFNDCVRGFSLVNKDSEISKEIWETVNSHIFEHEGVEILKKANGSHESGVDLITNIGKFSNKTSKINKKNLISISSYRLTAVSHDMGKTLDEIEKRNNSFDYVSLLARKVEDDCIHYHWYVIPKTSHLFDERSFEWDPTYNKNNKQTGWRTKKKGKRYISITLSMSSQMWFHGISTSDLYPYLVDICVISKKKNVMSYIDVFNLINNISTSSIKELGIVNRDAI